MDADCGGSGLAMGLGLLGWLCWMFMVVVASCACGCDWGYLDWEESGEK